MVGTECKCWNTYLMGKGTGITPGGKEYKKLSFVCKVSVLGSLGRDRQA